MSSTIVFPNNPVANNTVDMTAFMHEGATTASREAVKAAPTVTKAAKKFYERVRNRKRGRERTPTDAAPQSDGIPTADHLAQLEERVHALEANEEAQAELIAQVTQHQESQALVIGQLTEQIVSAQRRVDRLTLALIAVGLVALVALIVAVVT